MGHVFNAPVRAQGTLETRPTSLLFLDVFDVGQRLVKLAFFSPRLECGTVWINGHAEVLPHCPFGGRKMSGFGVEFGLEGLLEYTAPQLVNINTDLVG